MLDSTNGKFMNIKDFLRSKGVDTSVDKSQLNDQYLVAYSLYIIRSTCALHRNADPHGNCNDCPLLRKPKCKEAQPMCGVTGRCHHGHGHELYEGPLAWDIQLPQPWNAFK